MTKNNVKIVSNIVTIQGNKMYQGTLIQSRNQKQIFCQVQLSILFIINHDFNDTVQI